MRVVLIGFGPFPGVAFNPSAALAKALAHRRRHALAETVRTVHVFATTYASVDRDLPKLSAAKPDVLLMFGLAARRRQLCIETRARNAVSVLFPDASGYRPSYQVIRPDARSALTGTAPFATLLSALRRSPVPPRLSRDAGRYVCNYAYWRALESAQQNRPLVLFVHIPQIRPVPRPVRSGRRMPSLRSLVAAGEMLLIAVVAARRRQIRR
jgi:pyroglutamyl-peptidase